MLHQLSYRGVLFIQAFQYHLFYLNKRKYNNDDSMRDSEVKTSSGSSSNFLRPSFSSDHAEPELIAIYDDSGSVGMSMPSLEGKTYSSRPLDALIQNVGEPIDNAEVLLPHHVLSEDEVRTNLHMRELAIHFI